MIDVNHIKALLDKFWEAETTSTEEAEIKAYMISGNVDDELQYAVPFFKNVDSDSSSAEDIDTKIVTKLLDKYFEGNTSVEEEQLIKEYFLQNNVSPSLRQYKSMFNAFSNEAKVTYDKELTLPQTAKVVPLRTEGKSTIISMKWIKVASAAAFIGVAGYFFTTNYNVAPAAVASANSNKAAKYIEPETPEEALEVTMKALAMVSRKYKQGEQNLLDGMKTMNETNIMRE
jgi:hypothetical protein